MGTIVCWSAKGGSGTTVVAAALALVSPLPALLVDLADDAPAALGLPDHTGQGVADWLRSDAPVEAVEDLAVPVDATTSVVPRGEGPLEPVAARWAELASWLAARTDWVIVDAGTAPPPLALATNARSLLVTRACYLGLRNAARSPIRPDGVVLVAEPGRALRAGDVEHAVGAPVVTTVSVDPLVARAVDAGLLAARLPRALCRELRCIVEAPRAMPPLRPLFERPIRVASRR